MADRSNVLRLRRSPALAAIALVWLVGVALIAGWSDSKPVLVTHWANGHMMEREALLPGLATAFNASGARTQSGEKIRVQLVMANSGEISGELKARISYGGAIDRSKPDPTIVTPAADHWINDVNQALGMRVLDIEGAERIASTYIGIVTSREMAQCLGWPVQEIGFADVVSLATDPRGWSAYACARPEWGQEALLAFTYPARSSTARSVLFALYALAAGKPADQLTLTDVERPDVVDYIRRFHSAIDCYVPDTLDLNIKILSRPPCAQFFFIAEDNLVQLYQGKVSVPAGDHSVPTYLDRDLVMIYPREGAILHNHTAFLVNAPFASRSRVEAARSWIEYLRQDAQQRRFMQEGFRPTTSIPCVDPLGSPFSQCATTPRSLIYPDRIDATVALAILRAWE